MTPKRWPRVSAVRIPHSAMPSTGFAVASRAENRPGSLKQAMTKAAVSGSASRIARQSGAMTSSASVWLSTPGGPSLSVMQSIPGPPVIRNGAIASSIARVTASFEFGLIGRMRSGIGLSLQPNLPDRLPRRARLSRSFANGQRDGARQFSGAAILADCDKGELGFGHLDPLALALAQDPDFDVERDRGPPRARDFGVSADGVAAMHRLQKGDLRHGDRHDPPAGVRRRRHLSGRIHQRHDPAAEDVPPGIAVGGHRQGARGQLTPRLGRIPSPFSGTHPSISRLRISACMLRRNMKFSIYL